MENSGIIYYESDNIYYLIFMYITYKKGGIRVGIETFPWIYFVVVVVIVIGYFGVRNYKNNKK